VRDRPQSPGLDDREERGQRPESEESREDAIGRGRVGPRVEVVDEPEGPADGDTGEEEGRPRRGIGSAGETRGQTGEWEEEREEDRAAGPALRGGEREQNREAEDRKPIGRAGRKCDSERETVAGESRDEEKEARRRARPPGYRVIRRSDHRFIGFPIFRSSDLPISR
jgi:hypothetical protein